MSKKITKTSKSITELILGSSANVKILDCLLDGREVEYTMSDLAEAADISRQHAYRVVKGLIEHSVVKRTRVVGGTQLYQINPGMIGKGLLAFQDVLLKYQGNRIENEWKVTDREKKLTLIKMKRLVKQGKSPTKQMLKEIEREQNL